MKTYNSLFILYLSSQHFVGEGVELGGWEEKGVKRDSRVRIPGALRTWETGSVLYVHDDIRSWGSVSEFVSKWVRERVTSIYTYIYIYKTSKYRYTIVCVCLITSFTIFGSSVTQAGWMSALIKTKLRCFPLSIYLSFKSYFHQFTLY